MKKGFILFTSVLMFLFCITGCNSSSESNSGSKAPVKIKVWTYYSGSQMQAFDDIVEEFNLTKGKEIGVIVNAESKGSIGNLIQAINSSVNNEVGSEPLPNIMSGYLDMAYELEQKDLLAELDSYFSKEELSEYIEGYINEGRFDEKGSLKVFPVVKSSEVLIINKTVWDEFSAQTGASAEQLATWEGITQLSQKYYNWCGKAFYGRDSEANYFIIGSKQLGKEIFEVKNGKVKLNLDKDIMKKLWDNSYIPYINGYFTKKGKFRSDDAKTGDLIAWIGSTASAVYLPEEVIIDDKNSYPMEVMVLPVPNFENTKPYAVQQGAGMMVTKSEEEYQYASAEFLKWITEPEINIKFALNASYAPVTKSSNSMESINSVISQDNIKISESVKKTMEIMVNQAMSYDMFTSKPFANASAARNILEYSLSDKAAADRAEIERLIAEGKMSPDSAVALYDTQENFEQWFENLKMELELAVNE